MTMPAHTTALGTTIHGYAATAALARPAAFRCVDRFAFLFARGPLSVLPDARRTLLPAGFRGPVHGEHVRDTMARAAGASRTPEIRLSRSVDRSPGRVALCPHAAAPFKEWRPERWAALAEALLGQGLTVVACSEPGRDLLPWPSGVVETQHDLATLADELARSALVVAVDSGPAHLADLFWTPVVGLYAATSPVTYGPYGSRSFCVDRHRDAFPAGHPYDTSRHIHGSPMDAVTVPTVLRHVAGAFTNDP